MNGERSKKIMDYLDSKKIGVDESFRFHCTMCGNCCIHREDIILSPRDIYRMSKELGLSPEELVERYCEAYVGEDSRIPLVRILPRGQMKRCPLLKNRKCRVHRVKPAICAMFPVGRYLNMEGKENGFKDLKKDDEVFFFENPGCGDESETHTVREWMEEFGISVEDEYFIQWHQAALELGAVCHKMEKKMGSRVMEPVWSAVFYDLYLHYNTEEDFQPQFERNAKKILETVNGIFKMD